MSADITKHEYIDTVDALVAFCQPLLEQPYIILDTEFLRERTYRPELCLVQLKCGDALAIIDTPAIDDLAALEALLQKPEITKVFHAASQDLEIFYLLSQKVPKPIFDTQIAAPLLGYPEQVGYANLVQEHLGVELAKSHTRADWTRRPLPDQQIAYALDDVIYLEELYLDMRSKLEKLGRLEWLQPEFAAWEDAERYEQPAGERWKKVRNVQRLKGPALAVTQALARWREIKARETNQPRNWLMKDEILLTLARQLPDSVQELSHIRGLDRKVREKSGDELIALIAQAQLETPEPLPDFVKKQKLDSRNLSRVQLLQTWVHQRACDLDIAPGLLAPQKLLENAVTGNARAALAGWREPLLGDDFEALLEGRAGIAASSTALELIETP